MIGAASLTVLSISALNSCGVDDTATDPDFSTSARYSGELTIVPIRLLSRSTISFGVPDPAQMPSHA